MQEKTCFKCFVTKPLTEYYVHKMMADGHLNKCKECTKKDSNKHRYDNLEEVKAYDRKRGNTPEHRAKNRERYREEVSSEEGRRAKWDYNTGWRRKNKVKRVAHNAVWAEIKAGRLVRQPCERCSATKRNTRSPRRLLQTA